MEFTKNQKTAINLRNKNILVSASAGTGKTAVLTERIIEILLDRTCYQDIDRMLVVTFTKAAAFEMRSRISDKLSERFAAARKNSESPEYIEQISKQMALLPHAQITTIDSLCNYILKNYYFAIGIDPAVTIADEVGNRLMLSGVINDVIEKRYGEKSSSFIKMVEAIVPGKDDREINRIIEDLYNAAVSHVDPDEWLMQCKSVFCRYESPEEIDEAFWMKESMFVEYIALVASDAKEYLKKALEICEKNNDSVVAERMTDFLYEEYYLAESLSESKKYSEIAKKIQAAEFARFPSYKTETEKDVELKEEIKKYRDLAKDIILKIKKNDFSQDWKRVADDIYACKDPMCELIDITLEVIQEFDTKKRRENVADFNDIEHFALKILSVPEIASELRESYDHILIDEYQDSNEIQEKLLSELSRESIGENNRFMVGDSKQSIYSFRLADPEIFEKKNREYSIDEGELRKIFLDNNFRSSTKILKGINHIFENLMRLSFGGVDYDENHSFKTYKDDDEDEKIEAIYIEGKEDYDLSDYSKQEIEAHEVAERIFELTDPSTGLYIKDEETGKERLLKYSDIVILLRSMTDWSDTFSEVLTSCGIPVVTEEKRGYFSAFEIQTVLSMLKIIDNPYQDIPFAAAMKSQYGAFDDNELAIILSGDGEISVFDAVKKFALKEGELGCKCAAFVELLNDFRKKAPYMKTSELIEELIETGNFSYCVSIMPRGERRLENLKMLIQKSVDYETYYSCYELFGFLQYIDGIQSANIDFGEAGFTENGDGAVSIMSIHKSKGLEFPVVFVSAMEKQFNLSDYKKSPIVHKKLGLGPDAFYPETRVMSSTLIKSALKRRIIYEIYSEELRVLYVALTRAKTKLILIGYVKNYDKYMEDHATRRGFYSEIFSGKATFFSWITSVIYDRDDLFEIKRKETDMCLLNTNMKAERINNLKRNLEVTLAGKNENKEIAGMLKAQLDFRYPYSKETELPVKVSVSEIKHEQVLKLGEDTVDTLWEEKEKQLYIPKFAKNETEMAAVAGSSRGTMYHSVMQYIDIEKAISEEEVRKQMEELVKIGRIPEEALSQNIVSTRKILRFCLSDIAKRMVAAKHSNLLYIEKPFVIGVPASEIYKGTNSTETILVQGVIDAFFEEDDGIVLLDYKTDRIENGEEKMLINRYKVQLDSYRLAIEKGMGKTVKETVLYSFSLGREIRL